MGAAWAELGAAPPEGWREQIEQAYAQGHRHYHGQRHLRECLALWWHDAVYEPRAADNEQRSAEWASRCLTAAGVSGDVVQRVHDLIMATRHDAPVHDEDAALLVDIDLAILGSPPQRFERYDEDIRKEYRWVPGFVYRRKRAGVLRQFLAREPLYHTAPARAAFEAQARVNLAAALARVVQK